MKRIMIVCSALLAAALANGCTGITSARSTDPVASLNSPSSPGAPAVPAAAPTGPGTIWFVRNDGGSRYDASYNPRGQCNGKSDAPYPGSGVNQPCAFNDVRYLWANGSAAGSWVLAGGDTAFIRGGPWRLGDINSSDNLFNGYSNNGSDNLHHFNPTIPAGGPTQHTRILGENYANCGTSYTQLFAGFALRWAFNLQDTSYVDVQCIELTDHNNCITVGGPAYPSQCSSSVPVTDAGGNGFIIDANSHDILLQDSNVHGLPAAAMYGPFGANITLTRVRFAFNGFAGWDMDNGAGIPGDENGANASVTANYLTMEWNGCNEEYPIVDSIPAESCYSQSSGGFGDAYSGQDTGVSSLYCDHCIFRYNTKDCFTGPHMVVGSVTVLNSLAHSNMGQCWKWNSGLNGTVLFQNNLTVSDCDRLSAPISGAPSNYNQYLIDFCRADGAAMSFIWPVNGSVELDNNTFVMASQNVSMDFGCHDQVSSISSIANGGSGYLVNDVVSIRGDFYGGKATVTSVGSGGVITGLSLTNGGTYFADFANPIPLIGGSGSGATINITYSKLSCNGGPRILRNNIFLGYTNPNNPSWNHGPLGLFCYTACEGSTGNTHDNYWTTRTNNIYYGFGTNSCGAGGSGESSACGACSYPGELCADPLFMGEPSQTWTNNAQLDPFNFSLSPGSPAKYTGVVIPGLTTDYYGNPWHIQPSEGAVE